MLNISDNSIQNAIKLRDFRSARLLRKIRIKRLSVILLSSLFAGIIISLFLPWTQNISAKGYVTTRSPEQRPQAIHSVLAGRLERWFVQEGNYVEKGDTIVFISEIKSEYFDPELLTRVSEQIDAKTQSIESYDQKIAALEAQYEALQQSLQLKRRQTLNKIEQARNKIGMDSIDLVAHRSNLEIADSQLSRTKELHNKGLKSLTELQEKEYKLQAARAKVNVQINKLENQRNELINLQLELQSVEQNYADKLAKSRSDQQSAISAKLESVAVTSKLQNQFSNYSARQKLYYVTAPQSGYITQTLKKGIGETIKEGADIATIMPANYDVAVEIYAMPQDLPLLSFEDEVQIRFDGWPAIVFSGWPEASTGMFTGEIVAIDKHISTNGYYRVLISPNDPDKPWPTELSIGTGASAFILLNNVPIWYETWRQLNGFPADYYRSGNENNKDVKRKAPLKSVK